MTDSRSGPPLLLAIGLVLTIAKSLVYLAATGLAALVALGLIAAGSAPGFESAHNALPFLATGGLAAAAVFAAFALLVLFKLFVCVQAWRLRHGWLVALVVLTVLSLLLEVGGAGACCYLPTLIDVALLIGAGQALAGGRR